MKVAIISDVHADLIALDAALARAREMGCNVVICAGDLVEGGVFPDEVIARLASEQIPTIRGNHDRWALERANEVKPPGRRARRSDPQPSMHEGGESAVFGGGWDLTPASLRFLRDLPTSWSAVMGGARVVMWHASTGSDMEGIYPGTTPGSPINLARHLTRPPRTSSSLATRTRRSPRGRRRAASSSTRARCTRRP
jgi:predicted phosphodiesterase